MRMTCHRYVGPLILLVSYGAAAEGYVVAIGAEADTEDSYAISAFGELAVGDSTWLSAGAAMSRADVPEASFDSIDADVQIDRLFERWSEHLGVRLAVAYWGDSDVLESVDLRSSIYLTYPGFSLSADFERRNYDLVLGPPVLRDSRTAEFSADGVGFAGRLQTGERVSVYAGGMWYDYSRHAGLRPRIDELRFLSLSRLILGNGLIDSKSHAGIEVEFGLRVLDFSYANWQSAAAQGGSIDSFGVGFLTPLGTASDIEFRLSRDESDVFGDSTVVSVFLYFFGG
jgi:hypothetical protein